MNREKWSSKLKSREKWSSKLKIEKMSSKLKNREKWSSNLKNIEMKMPTLHQDLLICFLIFMCKTTRKLLYYIDIAFNNTDQNLLLMIYLIIFD